MTRRRPSFPWLLVAVMASSPVPAVAQGLTDTQRQEIAAEIERLTLEINSLNTAAGFDSLFSYWAADGERLWAAGPATFVNNTRVLPTLQDVRASFGPVMRARRSTNFTLRSSRVAVLSSDVALQVAEQQYSITDTLGNTGQSYPVTSTGVWVKRPAGWKLLHFHQSWSNTPITPPEAETFAGEGKCGSAGATQTRVPVGDRPDHWFLVGQGTCDHVKPGMIDGVALKSERYTGSAEVTGKTQRWQGYNVVVMANGDSVFTRGTCEGTEGPDGSIERSECRFTFDGGTGRFAALNGEGTSRGTANGDGTATWAYSGRYTLSR